MNIERVLAVECGEIFMTVSVRKFQSFFSDLMDVTGNRGSGRLEADWGVVLGERGGFASKSVGGFVAREIAVTRNINKVDGWDESSQVANFVDERVVGFPRLDGEKAALRVGAEAKVGEVIGCVVGD